MERQCSVEDMCLGKIQALVSGSDITRWNCLES